MSARAFHDESDRPVIDATAFFASEESRLGLGIELSPSDESNDVTITSIPTLSDDSLLLVDCFVGDGLVDNVAVCTSLRSFDATDESTLFNIPSLFALFSDSSPFNASSGKPSIDPQSKLPLWTVNVF